jgi:predicted GIY-YIG superfamily endonuclease
MEVFTVIAIVLFLINISSMHSVYILQSIKLNNFYTGFTSNFDLRLHFHFNSENRKFTHTANDWAFFLKIQFIHLNWIFCFYQ